MWLLNFVDKWQEKKGFIYKAEKTLLSSNEVIQSYIFGLVLGLRSKLDDLFPVALFPVTA